MIPIIIIAVFAIIIIWWDCFYFSKVVKFIDKEWHDELKRFEPK